MNENRVYVILETVRADDGGYIPCIAIQGEKGYYKTDWNWGNDLQVANKICDEKNLALGFSPKTAYKIVLSSMFAK